MKKYLLFLLLCFIGIASLAQSHYLVQNFNGEIMYKSSGDLKWTNVRKKMPLQVTDSLYVPINGNVVISDKNTHINHCFSQNGAYVVRSILKKTQDGFLDILKRLAKTLVPGSIPPPINFFSVGVSHMGDSSIEDSIATILSAYMFDRNNNYIFEVTNNSANGYYFNVAKIDRNQKKINICYNFSEIVEDEAVELSLFVPSGVTIPLNDIPFMVTRRDDFFLFATDRKFSVEVLQSILDNKKEKDTFFENLIFPIVIVPSVNKR